MKKQLLSFRHAAAGICGAFRTEAHLRFHAVAALFVLIFAGICGFSAERLAILWVLIGTVIAAEIINTSIEHTCNAVTREYSAQIKLAKDLAAGAVLVLAVAAAAVGVLFFLNADSLAAAVRFFTENPFAAVPLGLLAVLCALFVILGGKGRSK